MKFIAIDFETANANRHSPCELGMVKVEDFKIIEKKSFLIRPKDNSFDFFNTKIHGIDESMVADAPEFDKIYNELKADLESYPILMHNASFDISVLRSTLKLYDIEFPFLNYSCTYRMAKECLPGQLSYKLNSICAHLNIPLEHHRALNDAVACAQVAIHFFQQNGVNDFSEIEEKLNLIPAKVKPETYIANPETFQKDHVFFDKTIIFTGTLDSMVRKDAEMMVKDIGGLTGKGVTVETNFLVVGETDYSRYGEGYSSNKMKKAEKLLSKGQDIEMLTEGQFLDMIR